MESLHYGKILGEDRTNIGFCWEIAAGIYYANLGVRGSRWMGMRSRAPPVADAARRSIRSGRKNRASEQREDFFGHRKAVGANAAAGYLGSVSVRSTDDASASFVSSTASDRKGFVKGEAVPLDRVLPTFARTKVGPRRAGVLTMPLQKAPRRRQARRNLV